MDAFSTRPAGTPGGTCRALKPPRHGQKWERQAEVHLHRHGLRILQRNFHCRRGEVDLVMEDGCSIVFVEVRYRGSGSHASGLESVTRQKQLRLSCAAGMFLVKHPGLSQRPCRFDVVSIDGCSQQLSWVKNAFESVIG